MQSISRQNLSRGLARVKPCAADQAGNGEEIAKPRPEASIRAAG